MGKKAYQYQKIIFLIIFLYVINTCFLAAIAGAQENQAWEPPPPPPDEFDWIQLTSGEWLKGEIKDLYEKELEFASDKLKLQVFDWKDVKLVRSPRVFSARFTGPFTVTGSLEIDENKVVITDGDKKQEFDRDQLIAIAPKGNRERDFWSGKISFGFNYTKGNTEQIQYNTNVSIRRSTSMTRFIVDYIGNISETNNHRTIDSNRIQSQFDLFQTRKYYYRPLFAEYYRDPLKNIDYKLTAGCGIGYYFINTPRTKWEIGGGPGYQVTKFTSVELGQDDTERSLGLIADTLYDTKLTEYIDFLFKYTFQILNKVSGRYIHHTLTSFEIELTDSIDFDITFIWDRVQDPQPDDTGIAPDKDDFNLMLGLGVEF